MINRWLPKINLNRCDGCGDCVAACPTGALALRDSKAAWQDPAACTYCMACEDICRTGAIELPFLIQYAKEENSHEE